MAYIKFKEPIDVADDLKVNGTSLGSNAFTSTTIPTNNNQLTNGRGYITLAQVPSIPTVYNSKITLSAGDGLSSGGDFTLNQSSAETITFNVDSTVVRTTGAQTPSRLPILPAHRVGGQPWFSAMLGLRSRYKAAAPRTPRTVSEG